MEAAQASMRIRLPDGRSTRSAKNMAEVFKQAVRFFGSSEPLVPPAPSVFLSAADVLLR